MIVKVEDIEFDLWESGYPCWFHIRQGDKEISFSHKVAPMISDVLKNLVELSKQTPAVKSDLGEEIER
jgi:hypothetical protein